jgi:hypothetical protein
MYSSHQCSFKEKKRGFVETGEEFEQTELNFKKNNQRFKVAGDTGGMSKRAPFFPFWVMAWNISLYISCFLTLTRSMMHHLHSEYSLHKRCNIT